MVAGGTGLQHKFAIRSYAFNSHENENLRIILNYIRDKQELSPSIVSLVFSDVRSNFVDLVSNYVGSEPIISYKITTDDLSQNDTWQNRIDLTWIFILDNINILNTFVHKQNHIWKTTNQYLIINIAPSIATLSQDIFQIIWKNYNVYKIVAISIQDDFQCLSRYLPFEKNQWDEYGVVRQICLMERENNVELYANFENLNGYPIRVVVFPSLMMNVTHDEGMNKSKFSKLDADAMLLLEKAMQAKFLVNVLFPQPHEDPFHRTLQYIENGKSEVIITSFFIYRYEEFQNYEFTASIYEDKLCLIAPTSGFVPKSYMPIMPFTPDLWVLLAIYNVIASVLWFLIKYYSELFRRQEAVLLPLTRTTERFVFSIRQSDLSPRIHPYVSSCFYLVETLCYPLKENNSSTSSTISQRAFLFGTLFFGLIVIGLYQSCLVSSLSHPFHYPELNTLEDIADSNFTIITKYHNLKQNIFVENTTLVNKLRNKIKVIVSDKPTNHIVAFTKKVIAIGRYKSFKLDDLSDYYDVDGNEVLHIVEECPYTLLLSYIVKLYSPYRERINELLLRMREAGLVNLWYENMAYPVYEAEQKRKMAMSERRIKLTMEHYSLTFVGLLFGLLFCIFVFLAELYFAKRSQSLIK
ncbi:hypothetical protein DMN91_011410 [Ooceraea biroi]|uniref:Ionotropic glutamate receptor C-terminal domain-containing protein n=2 Tax=Ooceraea biroi TaxID=2015173 RepID=A0A3L8D5Z7_OOCBI|nr:hypothetical protein DMN91_011410 [Ooceraea biroi]